MAWALQPLVSVGLQILFSIFLGWLLVRLRILDAEKYIPQVNTLVLWVGITSLSSYNLGLKLQLKDPEAWRSLAAFILWVALTQAAILGYCVMAARSRRRAAADSSNAATSSSVAAAIDVGSDPVGSGDGGRGDGGSGEYSWLRESALLTLVLTANNCGMIGLPIMDATFGDPGRRLALLTGIPVFLYVVPFAIFMYELHAARQKQKSNRQRRRPSLDKANDNGLVLDGGSGGGGVSDDDRSRRRRSMSARAGVTAGKEPSVRSGGVGGPVLRRRNGTTNAIAAADREIMLTSGHSSSAAGVDGAAIVGGGMAGLLASADDQDVVLVDRPAAGNAIHWSQTAAREGEKLPGGDDVVLVELGSSGTSADTATTTADAAAAPGRPLASTPTSATAMGGADVSSAPRGPQGPADLLLPGPMLGAADAARAIGRTVSPFAMAAGGDGGDGDGGGDGGTATASRDIPQRPLSTVPSGDPELPAADAAAPPAVDTAPGALARQTSLRQRQRQQRRPSGSSDGGVAAAVGRASLDVRPRQLQSWQANRRPPSLELPSIPSRSPLLPEPFFASSSIAAGGAGAAATGGAQPASSPDGAAVAPAPAPAVARLEKRPSSASLSGVDLPAPPSWLLGEEGPLAVPTAAAAGAADASYNGGGGGGDAGGGGGGGDGGGEGGAAVQGPSAARQLVAVLWAVGKNPLLWSLLLSLSVNLSGLRHYLDPESPSFVVELGFIEGLLKWFAATAIPVSLVSIGVWMYGKRMPLALLRRAGVLLLLKLLALPALQVGCAVALRLPADATVALLLLALCPTATTSFVIAAHFGYGADEVVAVTVGGTLLLVPALLAALQLPRALGIHVQLVSAK